MAIPLISLANTFAQWLNSTQQTITALNNLEANTYTKSAGVLSITSSGTGLNVTNTANIGIINSATVYSNNNISNTVTLSTSSTAKILVSRTGTSGELKWDESSKTWKIRNVNSGTYNNIITAENTATTVNVGIVSLTDSISSTSTTTAATPNSVKIAYDTAASISSTASSALSTAQAAYNKANTGGTFTSAVIVPNFTYTGTLTGSSSIINIGSGQIYKDTIGYVGLGTTLPTARLEVAGSGTVSKFGSTFPVYLMANLPAIGFNAYYNAGWKFGAGSASSYAGAMNVNAANGTMTFYTSGYGNANNPATMVSRLSISATGVISFGNSSSVSISHDGSNYSTLNNLGDTLWYNPTSTLFRWHINNIEAATLTNAYLNVNGYVIANSIGSTTVSATGKTLMNSEKFFLSSGASGVTVTLPASPAIGNFVTISVSNQTDTIIARNGSNIMGLAENMTIDKANVSISLVYADSTIGWKIV